MASVPFFAFDGKPYRFYSKNALHPQGVFFVHKGSKKRRMAKAIRRFLFV